MVENLYFLHYEDSIKEFIILLQKQVVIAFINLNI